MTLAILTLVGALSQYHVGDGHNAGTLACGGQLRHDSHHVAIRQWRGRCGATAVVCALATKRCVETVVRDAGPFGIVPIKGKGWRVWVKLTEKRPRKLLPPPPGWRWRGIVDVSRAVWIELGRPRFLTKAVVWVLER